MYFNPQMTLFRGLSSAWCSLSFILLLTVGEFSFEGGEAYSMQVPSIHNTKIKESNLELKLYQIGKIGSVCLSIRRSICLEDAPHDSFISCSFIWCISSGPRFVIGSLQSRELRSLFRGRIASRDRRLGRETSFETEISHNVFVLCMWTGNINATASAA